MKIILKKDFESLGQAGQVIQVKDGYARNYLIPQGIALPATESYLRAFKEEKKREVVKKERDKRIAENLAVQLEKISCTAAVPVGEEDRVFGSVTSQTIAELLQEKGFDIDRRKILLDQPIKALGIYTIPIKLHPEVEAKIKVWVVKE